MSGEPFVSLPGSERAPLPAAENAGPVNGAQRIEVTLITRRRAALPRELVEGPGTVTREQLAARHGTDPADVDTLRTVLAAHGLEITEADPGARRVKVAGSVAALSETFGAQLSMVRSTHPVSQQPVEHRYREGSLRLPAELNGIVLAVLGLDDRPQARPQFRRAPATTARVAAGADTGTGTAGAGAPGTGGPGAGATPAAAPTSYTPPQVAQFYQFPGNTTGTGHTLAIIELGGGFGSSDLDPYFAGLGIPVPSVTAASVDGAANAPGQDPNGADGEVLLDIEVAGAVAPGAAQVVYFAPNTDQGFVDGVTSAVHASPTPTAISISWGQSEDTWTAQGRTALDQAMADAAALGITVCVAAGDNGSADAQTDGAVHADFPASSPHALACGGTSLRGNASNRGDQLRDGLERRPRAGLDRWRGQRCLPAAVLAVVGRGARPGWCRDRRRGRAGRARRGRLRGPGYRIPGPGGRAADSGGGHERGRPAVGGPGVPAGTGHGTAVRPDPAVAVPGRGRREDRRRVPRYHQRQQRRLRGRARLGCVHRARLTGGDGPAGPAGQPRGVAHGSQRPLARCQLAGWLPIVAGAP